jgi:type I restriction enzyme, S subunit
MKPHLRFSSFSGNWTISKVGAQFTIKAGGDIDPTYVSKEKTNDFKYPIYANAEKKKGLYGYSNRFKVSTPSITIAGRGVNIGIAHARSHKFYPIVRLLVLTPKSEQSIKYFEYAFNRLNIFVESTGVPQLTSPQISGYEIAFPSLPEQQKIAAFLSAVDKKIQLLQRKKELLEQYKKGVMQKIFSQEIRFKDEDGNDYPDWEEKRLEEIGETFNGLTGKTAIDFGEGKPFITYKQIFDSSKIDTTKYGYVNVNSEEHQSKVEYGDVFFTTSSETRLEVGFSSVFLGDTEELYLNSFCFGYRINSHRQLYPNYARYLFRSEGFRKAITKLGQGSTRYNVSKNAMKKMIVTIPKLREQLQISSFLSNLDEKMSSINNQHGLIVEFKKGLLQQMFV